MSKTGRPVEDKVWETRLRHYLSFQYGQEPDLHVLLFASGEAFKGILAEALRDWMVKHNSPCLDPDFRAQLFMTASMELAKGNEPSTSLVLEAMGAERPVATGSQPNVPSIRGPRSSTRRGRAPAPQPEAPFPAPVSPAGGGYAAPAAHAFPPPATPAPYFAPPAAPAMPVAAAAVPAPQAPAAAPPPPINACNVGSKVSALACSSQ